LTTDVGRKALDAAAAQPDPDSLAAATALRGRFAPELAAAALTQVALRRSAAAKLGRRADHLLLSRTGLEQASRAAVAAHHAERFVAAGVGRVVDLGCGVGTDTLALLDAGLEVIAVEAEPETASLAQANLAGRAEVLLGDAVELAPGLLGPGIGAYADPARRTARGRSWRTEDLSPPWPFVASLLTGERSAGVKLGPGLPHRIIPAGVEAEWVSDGGDTVEVGLWAGPGAEPDARVALLLPGHRLTVDPDALPLAVGEVGRLIYEPDGAVIRAGGVATLGQRLGAWLLHPDIAYLSCDSVIATPYATCFEVQEVHPYSEQNLRRWTRQHQIGTLEIKKRGLDLDPATLRRRLRLRGTRTATVILSRTPGGVVMAVVARLAHRH
jgi:hypothetical protein